MKQTHGAGPIYYFPAHGIWVTAEGAGVQIEAAGKRVAVEGRTVDVVAAIERAIGASGRE